MCGILRRRLDDGYEGIVAHIVDEAAASARYEEVDFALAFRRVSAAS